jgi:hypothetical protein
MLHTHLLFGRQRLLQLGSHLPLHSSCIPLVQGGQCRHIQLCECSLCKHLQGHGESRPTGWWW